MYVIIGILIVVCFIAGINVGLHGFSLDISPIGSEDAHLWVKIPGIEGREHPGITAAPAAVVTSASVAPDTGISGIKVESKIVDAPVLSNIKAESVKIVAPAVVVAVAPAPVPALIPAPAPVPVIITQNDHGFTDQSLEKKFGDRMATETGVGTDIVSLVESHKGKREMQLKQLFVREQQNVADHPSPIASFLVTNKKIPIIILTCNRLELLDATVQSLLQVRGVSASSVAIIQDGALAGVQTIGLKYSLRVLQNTLGLNLRGGAMSDGGSRIATHYKFSLSQAFDHLFPDAPAVIVVEDDLLFSPDFYEYFRTMAPILDRDKSLLCISAWNDNGLKGKVRSKYALKRTEFFPGLGWLVTRSLYKGELEAKWPINHWDHWLRSPAVHKGRDIVHPEVPRTFHNGIKGTFMNMDTHNKYFRDIDYNTDPAVNWDLPELDKQLQRTHRTEIDYSPSYLLGVKDIYLMTRMQRFDQCDHIANAGELITKLLSPKPTILCIWITAHPESNPEFAAISSFFKIWHEYKRGSYHGVHEFYFLSHYVLLINTLIRGEVQSLQPLGVSVIASRYFNSRELQQRLAGPTEGEAGLVHVKSASAGVNCEEVCYIC